MRYYRNNRLYADTPLATAYLRWAYAKGIKDLTEFNIETDFKKKDFTCLLCGVGNSKTANEFIQFVIARNPTSTIWIIDIVEEHINLIKKLVEKKFPNQNIYLVTIDALELLSVIPRNSVDWIETDAFIEFFDHVSLGKLFSVWYELLKLDGFITTRDYIQTKVSSKIINPLRIMLMQGWLGMKIYMHDRKELRDLFNKTGFKMFEGHAFLPTFRRFLIIKK